MKKKQEEKKQEEMAMAATKGKKRAAEDEPSADGSRKKQKQEAEATNKAAGKKRAREDDKEAPAVAKKAKVEENQPVKQKERAVETKSAAPATTSGPSKVESSTTSSKTDQPTSKPAPPVTKPTAAPKKIGAATSKPALTAPSAPPAAQTTAAPKEIEAASSKSAPPTSKSAASVAKPEASSSKPAAPSSKPAPSTAKAGTTTAAKGKKRAAVYDEGDAAPAQPAKKRKTAPAKKPVATKKGKAEPAKGRKAAPAKKKKKARLPNGLDIFVCGSGLDGELGLGPVPPAASKKASVQVVREPRLNQLLDNDGVGAMYLAAGARHGAALTHDGQVVTWGAAELGVLGRYTVAAADAKEQKARAKLDRRMAAAEVRPGCTPAVVESSAWPAGTRFKQVVATESATFAVVGTSDDLSLTGAVYGWGTIKVSAPFLPTFVLFLTLTPLKGDTGRPFGFDFGTAAKYQKVHERPTRVRCLQYVKRLAAGANHVVALSHTGQVLAWGNGGRGQLGRRVLGFWNERIRNLLPQEVPFAKKVVDVWSGAYHSFAVDEDGEVWAWGANDFAQTGTATVDGAPVTEPVRVAHLRQVKLAEIAGGAQHSVARTVDGRVLVWGRCEGGRLGVDAGAAPADHRRDDGEGRPVALEIPTEVSGKLDPPATSLSYAVLTLRDRHRCPVHRGRERL